MAVSKEDVKAVLRTVAAVAEAIRELGSVPSGHMYAQLSSRVSISVYERIIETLRKAGVIRESGHLLTWVGPVK